MLVEESEESGSSTREMSGRALAVMVFSDLCTLVVVSIVISTATSTYEAARSFLARQQPMIEMSNHVTVESYQCSVAQQRTDKQSSTQTCQCSWVLAAVQGSAVFQGIGQLTKLGTSKILTKHRLAMLLLSNKGR